MGDQMYSKNNNVFAGLKKRRDRRVIKAFFLILVFILTLSIPALARISEPPKSFTTPCKSLESIKIMQPDKKQIIKNSLKFKNRFLSNILSLFKKNGIGTSQCTYKVDWNIKNIDNNNWEYLNDGYRIYRLGIKSKGAKYLSLAMLHFKLPDGAKLWIYNGYYVEGPYSNSDNKKNELWTPMIPYDLVYIEISLPPGITEDDPNLNFEIKRVTRGVLCLSKECNVGQNETFPEPRNIGVSCPEAVQWQDQISSVVLITIEGKHLCSGILLNNTNEDCTPYILTAYHCWKGIDFNRAHTIVVYWNHQSQKCTGTLQERFCGNLSYNQMGATVIASWKESDFVLLKLDEIPDHDYNVYYSGWDATGRTREAVVGIHHPLGFGKTIVFSEGKISKKKGKDRCGDYNNVDYWWVKKWKQGKVEDYSSGSGLWDVSNFLLIGQLKGTRKGVYEGPSWYGSIYSSWEGGGNKQTRLKDWLDPCNKLEGKEIKMGGKTINL